MPNKKLWTGKFREGGDYQYKLPVDTFQKEAATVIELIKKRYPKGRKTFYILLLKEAANQIELKDQLKTYC